jgi:hypothetical protein
MQMMMDQFGNPEELSVEEMLQKYRFVEAVPHWHDLPGVTEWIEHHRTSNEFQLKIPLIERADEILKKIDREIEPIVAYITARPELIRSSTKQWLDLYQLPPAALIMNPVIGTYQQNHSWKAGVLDYLYPEVTGIVEDNGNIIEYLSESYQGHLYLIGGATCTREGLNVYECADWAAVHQRMVALKD